MELLRKLVVVSAGGWPTVVASFIRVLIVTLPNDVQALLDRLVLLHEPHCTAIWLHQFQDICLNSSRLGRQLRPR